ncbi:zinc transporter ZIP2-like [Tiliqua scincoides]|uniref:zinc transporter ZIP2-like n=1 Tax=Tiliqua scincoides TaxID=71010 RepID=UPI00346294D1
MATTLEALPERQLTLSYLTGRLMEEEMKRADNRRERGLTTKASTAREDVPLKAAVQGNGESPGVFVVRRCYACGSTRHLRHECPSLKDRFAGRKDTRRRRGGKSSDVSVVQLVEQESEHEWLLDSGASQHGNFSQKHNSTSEDDDSDGYPFGELIISLGFFLVFFIESIVLQCCPRAVHSHGDHESHADHKSGPESHSSFRAFVLFISLSFHSVFEGLAIGVQKEEVAAIQLCLAVLIHKAIVVFSLTMKLVQSGTDARWRLLYLVVFALMSPAGIGVGIGVLSNGNGSSLAQAVLEGVAAGTFLYVTFLEILPYELRSHESLLAKFFFIGLGFSVMAVIAI